MSFALNGSLHSINCILHWGCCTLVIDIIIYFKTNLMSPSMMLLNKCSGWANQRIYLIFFNHYCHQAPEAIGLGIIDVSSGQCKGKPGNPTLWITSHSNIVFNRGTGNPARRCRLYFQKFWVWFQILYSFMVEESCKVGLCLGIGLLTHSSLPQVKRATHC